MHASSAYVNGLFLDIENSRTFKKYEKNQPRMRVKI